MRKITTTAIVLALSTTMAKSSPINDGTYTIGDSLTINGNYGLTFSVCHRDDNSMSLAKIVGAGFGGMAVMTRVKAGDIFTVFDSSTPYFYLVEEISSCQMTIKAVDVP